MVGRVVFVHLGKRQPRHLWANLSRQNAIFPNVPVSLVLSDRRHLTKVPQGIEVLFYERTAETEKTFRTLATNPDFRQGFWLLTLERLLALEVAHNAHPEASLLHIESDVILMPYFPWDYFLHVDRLMWGQASASEDIAALIFSPSLRHTKALAEFTRKHAGTDPYTNDMKTLRAFYDRNQQLVSRLPIAIEDATDQSGVFDVLAIGMWLGGMDPSNARGIRTYHISMPHHTVQAANYQYSFSGGELSVTSKDGTARVNSLHIHSKDLHLFGKNWQRRLDDLVRLARHKPQPVIRFSILGFLGWAREFLREIFSRKFAVAVFKKLLRLPRN